MNYRYTLDGRTGHKKYTCPNCKRLTLNRYYDPETGDYFPFETVGKCDHRDHCCYHYTPRQYYKEHESRPDLYPVKRLQPFKWKRTPPDRQSPDSFHYFKQDFVNRSLNRYESNNLYLYLSRLFGSRLASYLMNRYRIGTANYLPGIPVFWYIDYNQRATNGKMIHYPDPKTGKRYKGDNLNKPAVNWVHSVMKLKDFKKKRCFFGEHLLSQEPEKPVIIVESEKTALITSIFFPDYISLATGTEQISDQLYWELLRDRKTLMIPDFSIDDKAFEHWRDKAKEFNEQFKIAIEVSDLNSKVTDQDKQEGKDIADLLTKDTDPEQGYILFEKKHPIFLKFTTAIINGKETIVQSNPVNGESL